MWNHPSRFRLRSQERTDGVKTQKRGIFVDMVTKGKKRKLTLNKAIRGGVLSGTLKASSELYL